MTRRLLLVGPCLLASGCLSRPAARLEAQAALFAAPLVRSFPPEAQGAPLSELGADGSSVLWRAPLVAVSQLELSGVERPDPAVPQSFRRRGRGPALVGAACSWPRSVPAAALRQARAFVYFHEPQAAPPLARLELGLRRATGAVARASQRARAVGSGQNWWLEADWPQSAGEGEVTALRIVLERSGGDRFNVGQLELLGVEPRADRGYLRLQRAGETRPVVRGDAAQPLEIEARLPHAGRLVGEVSLLAGSSPEAVAEVSAAAPGGASVRRAVAIAGRGRWTPYELPLAGLGEGPIRVRLALRADAGAAALWTEPVVLPGRRGRGIVLISLDTLREDAVFPPSGREPLMPRLAARAAREGQVARRHYAPSTWTLPSHASMLSGLYPTTHGATTPHMAQDLDPVDALAAQLGRAGFRTAAITDGVFVSALYGLSVGFDRFLESDQPPRRLERLDARYQALRPWLGEADFFLLVHTYFLHDYFETVDPAVPLPPLPDDLRAALTADPAPMNERLRRLGRGGVAADQRLARLLRLLYAWRARLLDEWLDRFLDALIRDFPDAPPLVLVTSDHGERFGDEGWHHGGAADEAVLRVPLVILHADRRPRPAIAEPTSGVDLAATIRGLSIRAAGRAGDAGVDLLDAAARRERRDLLAENYSEGDNAWALVAADQELLADTRLDADGSRRDAWRLFDATPGGFVERPPAEAQAARPRLEALRREQLCRDVAGVFVEVVNAGERPRSVELELGLPDPASPRGPGLRLPAEELPFWSHFLDADDVVERGHGNAPTRLRLRLPPGDRDLLVLRTPGGRLRVRGDGRPLGLRAGARDLSTGEPVLLGSGGLPPQPAPPAGPGSGAGVVVRVWRNPGRGEGRSSREQREVPATLRERLRSMGYLD